MNLIEPKNLIWKYEAAASYFFLGLQYIFLAAFSETYNQEIFRQYVELWYYDIFFLMPVTFFTFFGRKIRVVVMSAIFIFALIYFYTEMGFNSIYFNTFLSIFLSYRYLFFNIDSKIKDNALRRMFVKLLILFPTITVTLLTEALLERLGITEPETLGDSTEMTVFGRALMFAFYYFSLSYLEYRNVKKQED